MTIEDMFGYALIASYVLYYLCLILYYVSAEDSPEFAANVGMALFFGLMPFALPTIICMYCVGVALKAARESVQRL